MSIGQFPLIGRWWWYRTIMKVAHRFDWHYAPVCPQIEPGTTRRWCQWCGLQQTVRHAAVQPATIRSNEQKTAPLDATGDKP